MNLNVVKHKIFNLNKNVKISEKSFEETLQKSNVLLGSTSSACVEAIVYGINVIIIASRNNLTANPIPVKYKAYHRICYSEKEICEEISNIQANKYLLNIDKESCLNDLFSRNDLHSTRQFISNINEI